MIGVSEGTVTCPITANNGYDVVVKGIDNKWEIFTDYSTHPFADGRPPKTINSEGLKSTASGRYQILEHFYDAYKTMLKLPDFSPDSQDKIATQLIKECGAIQDIEDGLIQDAIFKCRSRWASLPASPYGQRTNKLSDLIDAYENAGGTISA
jgi:muramidase (phage lysozyme)